MTADNKQQDNRSKYAAAMKYASLGTQMLVLLGLGVWGGLKLDEHWNTTPLFLVLFPVLGLVLSLYQLYRQLVKPKK